MPIVEIMDVTWKYGQELPDTLKNINLSIEANEFIGIMGPTGAGKSSLSYVIRGLIPDFFDNGELKGKAIVNNIEVSRSSPQLFADSVGNVFQDASSQILGTTVYDDIAFGPCNLGIDKEEVIRRVNTYIDKLHLKGKETRKPDSLSGGEMQRLVSAGTLCMEPSVLVMDEPAAELDPKGRNDLCDILDHLRQDKDITVILIEQDPELIAQYSTRVALMDDGKIKSFGPPKNVFENVKLCDQIGVALPEMAQLAHYLRDKGGLSFDDLPISTTEMYQEILKILGRPDDATSQLDQKNYTYSTYTKDETALFQFDHVVHTYETENGPFNAVDGVSLNIYKGDYITLVGTNGAGKTTLTKHINNILEPKRGETRLKGKNIKGRDTSEFLSEIGYCFQNPDHQIFSSTVSEEVAYGLINMGLEKEEIDRKVDEYLEIMGLSEAKHENPFNLGKGERQKIAIASTIIMEPELLVIDEPTTGLDWSESKKILELIEQLHRKGMTILAVTHDMRIVREYSSRVVAMNGGRIVYDGDMTGLLNYKRLFENANISMPPIMQLYHLLKSTFPEIGNQIVRTNEDLGNLIIRLIQNTL